MSYSTFYKLEITDTKGEEISESYKTEIIHELYKYSVKITDCIDYRGNSLNDSEWFNNERDLCNISKDYPELVFTLKGIGRVCDFMQQDIWVKFFHKGKFYTKYTNIVFDKFNIKEFNLPDDSDINNKISNEFLFNI